MLSTKQKFRNYAKNIRSKLDIFHISCAICELIRDLEVYKNAKVIAGFYPFGSEVDLRPLYQDISKQWYLPKVVSGTEMLFYPHKTEIDMKKSKYGIYEPPVCDELKPDKPDLIFVPALIIDKKGHRIGYGKGYYDRFLSRLAEKCIKIVPIPEELITENLPYEEFDMPVDMAVSQRNIYRFK